MLVGLTGGIGSGKSTVAGMLAEAGMVVIDADAIAREVVEPGEPALAAIAERFGDTVIDDGGGLDRAALAAIVFRDDDERAALEAITHPAIRAEVSRRHRAATARDPEAIVVLDHPLLVETDQVDSVDALVVVLAPARQRRDRLVTHRGMDPDDVDARMASQVDDATRRAAATHVLDNSGSRDDLAGQVADLVTDLRQRSAGATTS
ncbi:dephospho-CoA kinase [Salsipaludibacter albus]|uniref:dephospho-CoA kinase n=1 Tax=Salsipaludibacter albus TaxID=2849650 RepID=UPI002367A5EC|nr:dephospho-CoA kinase [Salsipaludibacter albus]